MAGCYLRDLPPPNSGTWSSSSWLVVVYCYWVPGNDIIESAGLPVQAYTMLTPGRSLPWPFRPQATDALNFFLWRY